MQHLVGPEIRVNLSVNTDAQERPRAARAPCLGRRLLSR